MIIQYADTNVGPGFFSELGKEELLISSIFFTIQGEGPYCGCPSVFIRFAGCNRGNKAIMGCTFCDTDFRTSHALKMSFGQIELAARDLYRSKSSPKADRPLIVITGGEPMMQDNIVGLIEYLMGARWMDIQIESNGDRIADRFLDHPICRESFLVVSPKVVGGIYRPLREEVFTRADAIKFVIDAEPRSPYSNVPDYAHDEPDKIILSPMTVYKRAVAEGEIASAWNVDLVDQNATRANYAYAAALALRQGFRLSMQQHLFYGVP
jgi:7-carboxy-7-deazaguanine synthase